MAIIGKRKIPEQIIPAREMDEKICDICGADGTGRTPCQRCGKDLCSSHQLDVLIQLANFKLGEEWAGIFCKECLIAEINERY